MPFLLLLLLYTIPPSSSDVYQYTSCRQNFSCGNVTATFPFWGAARESYCGLPSFNLLCDNGQPKILMQQQQKLRILSFHQQQRTMKVLRDDLSNTLCPSRLISTPQIINYTTFPLLFNNNSVLAIYYGCRGSVDEDQRIVSTSVLCSNSTVVKVWASVGDNPNIRDDRCNSTVVIPVEGGSEFGSSSNSTTIGGEVDKGFTLGWVYSGVFDGDCVRCMNSDGVCGVGDGGIFACFCSDGVRQNYTCSTGSGASSANSANSGKVKKSKRVPLIVGLAVASTMAAALTSLSFYIIRLKRSNPLHKKQLNPFFTSSTTQESFHSDQSDQSDQSEDLKSSIQHFSYTDLQQSTNNFHPSKQLGEGGFGIVYHGRLKDGREVAVKRLFERNFKGLEQFINEVEILTRLRHPNLVTLYGCTSRRSRDLLLVYEYVSNGTLSDHLRRPDTAATLTWRRRLAVAAETAAAVAYLHATDIIHRDIKTNNILLDSNFHVKVADFGISRLFPTDVTHVSTAPQGTPGYVDPEYYHCYHLTEKSDVYSFGVVLVELLSSKPAVDLGRKRHDINLANMALSRIQSRSLEELVDGCLGFKTDSVVREGMTAVAELAFRCLQAEREMRPCMDEVVEVLNGIDGGGEGGGEDRGDSPFSMRDNLDWATSVSSTQSVLGGLRNEFGVNTM